MFSKDKNKLIKAAVITYIDIAAKSLQYRLGLLLIPECRSSLLCIGGIGKLYGGYCKHFF